MYFEEEDHRGQVPFSSHYIKCTDYEHDFISTDIHLDHLAEIEFVRFLYSKVTFAFFSYCVLRKEVTMQSSHKQQGINILTSIRVNCLH